MLRDGAGRWAVPALCLAVLAAVTISLLLRRPALPKAQATPPVRPLPLAGVILVLDPGHGGADPGAERHGDCEAALTYRTAVEVAQAVRQAGGQVVFTVRSRALDPELAVTEPPLTLPTDAVLAATGQPLRLRRDDTPRPLWLRAAVARHLWHSCSDAADRSLVFLSLHYDDYHQTSVSGALVCVDRRMPEVPEFARVLAAELHEDGLARHDVWHGLPGIAARHLGVLDPDVNPVTERALLEVATISNSDDAISAADPAWRHQMADRIVEALIATRQHETHASPHDTAAARPAVQ